jgi:hypothetical protein
MKITHQQARKILLEEPYVSDELKNNDKFKVIENYIKQMEDFEVDVKKYFDRSTPNKESIRLFVSIKDYVE